MKIQIRSWLGVVLAEQSIDDVLFKLEGDQLVNMNRISLEVKKTGKTDGVMWWQRSDGKVHRSEGLVIDTDYLACTDTVTIAAEKLRLVLWTGDGEWIDPPPVREPPPPPLPQPNRFTRAMNVLVHGHE